ncbi:MAG: hypothetical protein II937_14630 [Bacteroidales bacterium]|nr:hypothetical protein [Bacteroidales bacterium]
MADEVSKIYAVEKDGGNAMSLAALMTALNNAKSNPAEMMALLNSNGVGGNNALWIIFMFMLWQNNGGFGGNGNGGALQAMNVDDQLNAIRTQINNNSNTDLLNQAIRGNAEALQQLALNIGANYTAVSNAICGVQNAITSVGGKIDFNAERTINAYNLGNSATQNIMQQGFCGIKTTLLEQSAQDRLEGCQRANATQNTITQASTNMGIAMQAGFTNIANLIRESMQNDSQNTQKILDGLSQQTIQDLRDKLAKSENDKILAAIAAIKGTTAAGA